jgi:hypothetical protein
VESASNRTASPDAAYHEATLPWRTSEMRFLGDSVWTIDRPAVPTQCPAGLSAFWQTTRGRYHPQGLRAVVTAGQHVGMDDAVAAGDLAPRTTSAAGNSSPDCQRLTASCRMAFSSRKPDRLARQIDPKGPAAGRQTLILLCISPVSVQAAAGWTSVANQHHRPHVGSPDLCRQLRLRAQRHRDHLCAAAARRSMTAWVPRLLRAMSATDATRYVAP